MKDAAMKEKKPKKKEEGELRKYSGKDLIAMCAQLKTDRDLFISLRETCRFFYSPEDHNSYTGQSNTAGKQSPQNPTGIESARDLTAGLFSNTINLQDEFFGYEIGSKELADDKSIEAWFASCSEVSIHELAASNYVLSTIDTIHDYVVVCTAVQYSEMTEDKGLRFQNFMIDLCSIAEDKDGRINTVFRDFQMTACQAYELWGDAIPDEVMKQYMEPKTRYETEKYIHCVFPRLDYKKRYRTVEVTNKEGVKEPKQIARAEKREDMKYASYFILEKNGAIVEEGGYRQCPYAVPRFQINLDNNPYGRGVAFMTKGLMASLDILSADISDGIELGVNPPLFLSGSMSDQASVDITPGAVNFWNPAFDDRPFMYQAEINVADASAREEKLETQVKNMFYVNVFKMLEDHKNMTATEVTERVAEKIQMILPIIARLYDELYSVTLTHVFYLLLDSGAFPPMPEALKEVWDHQELRIKFTTRLDMKLDQLEIGQILKTIEQIALVTGAVQEAPGIAAVLKIDDIKSRLAKMNRMSPKFIKNDKETAEWNAAQEKQRQEEMDIEKMKAAPVAPIDVTQLGQNVKDDPLLNQATQNLLGSPRMG